MHNRITYFTATCSRLMLNQYILTRLYACCRIYCCWKRIWISFPQNNGPTDSSHTANCSRTEKTLRYKLEKQNHLSIHIHHHETKMNPYSNTWKQLNKEQMTYFFPLRKIFISKQNCKKMNCNFYQCLFNELKDEVNGANGAFYFNSKKRKENVHSTDNFMSITHYAIPKTNNWNWEKLFFLYILGYGRDAFTTVALISVCSYHVFICFTSIAPENMTKKNICLVFMKCCRHRRHHNTKEWHVAIHIKNKFKYFQIGLMMTDIAFAFIIQW